MTKVGDRVPKPEVRPERAIYQRVTVTAVEAVLPYSGCICCGALLDSERSLKHRAGCLYLAYTRATEDVHRLEVKLNLMYNVLKDARDVVNSPEARGLIRKTRP